MASASAHWRQRAGGWFQTYLYTLRKPTSKTLTVHCHIPPERPRWGKSEFWAGWYWARLLVHPSAQRRKVIGIGNGARVAPQDAGRIIARTTMSLVVCHWPQPPCKIADQSAGIISTTTVTVTSSRKSALPRWWPFHWWPCLYPPWLRSPLLPVLCPLPWFIHFPFPARSDQHIGASHGLITRVRKLQLVPACCHAFDVEVSVGIRDCTCGLFLACSLLPVLMRPCSVTLSLGTQPFDGRFWAVRLSKKKTVKPQHILWSHDFDFMGTKLEPTN